ncbi:hypothetical protein D3C72_1312200 [compost metagenome]
MNLISQFSRDMWKAAVVGECRVRGVTAKNNLRYAETFAGAKNCPNVMGRADIVGNNDNLGHYIQLYHYKIHKLFVIVIGNGRR